MKKIAIILFLLTMGCNQKSTEHKIDEKTVLTTRSLFSCQNDKMNNRKPEGCKPYEACRDEKPTVPSELELVSVTLSAGAIVCQWRAK